MIEWQLAQQWQLIKTLLGTWHSQDASMKFEPKTRVVWQAMTEELLAQLDVNSFSCWIKSFRPLCLYYCFFTFVVLDFSKDYSAWQQISRPRSENMLLSLQICTNRATKPVKEGLCIDRWFLEAKYLLFIDLLIFYPEQQISWLPQTLKLNKLLLLIFFFFATGSYNHDGDYIQSLLKWNSLIQLALCELFILC